MQVNQRLILIDHDRVQTTIVIEIADRQSAAEVKLLERLSELPRRRSNDPRDYPS